MKHPEMESRIFFKQQRVLHTGLKFFIIFLIALLQFNKFFELGLIY